MTVETVRERRSSSARWEDALDAQLEAYLFATSDRGRRYIKGWADSVTAKQGQSTWARFMRKATASLDAVLYNAEPIHVDPDMQTLWESACDGFVEEALHERDVLTENGFVYLPRPHHTIDVNGNDVSHRAFAWHPVSIIGNDSYNGKFGADDEGQRFAGYEGDADLEVEGRGIILYSLHRAGDPDAFDDKTEYATDGWGIRVGDWLVDGVYPWQYGSSPQYEGEPTGTPMTHDVQVLFRLLQQTITTRSPGRPNRPTRRRMKRAEFPERNVVIVRLRRPSAPTADEHEPRPVEWSHRWITSGHWRDQPYPSLGITRQIWISPYIKGPADKPLYVRKTRIFDWSK